MKTNSPIRRIAVLVLFAFAFQALGFPGASLAKSVPFSEPETLGRDIEVKVYSYKKYREFVAVEIGFTNKKSDYVPFTASEIYLNDSSSYSVAPLTPHDLDHVNLNRTHFSLIPLTVAIGLGIGAIGASNHGDVARGLALGALGAGGAFVLSEALENQARDNKLVAFDANSLESIDKLPPNVTLGGYLFFPRVKRPTSITIVTKGGKQNYEKKTLPLVKKTKH